MPDWRAITDKLEREHGIVTGSTLSPQAVGGGDINAAWRLETNTGQVFLKTSHAESADMFSAEAEGLQELADAKAIRVPAVLGYGCTSTDAYLVLEWLEVTRTGRIQEEALGHQLARQHRVTSETHGWHRDNTIGLTRQPNSCCDDWGRFFREQRLDHQLRLAQEKGYGGELQQAGQCLSADLDCLFDGYRPQASLLHGDLWGGNWAAVDGQPVIFDPAVYYGDRETDLAMSRLFGGFGESFYGAYEESWPLADGFEVRCKLYQLYHVLNHLNLFGRTYMARALQLIRELRGQSP